MFHKHASKLEVRWESCGLAWLARAGAPVVHVESAEGGELVEERLVEIPVTPDAAEHFAIELAEMHAAGAPYFGCGPHGWSEDIPGWIGRTRLVLGRWNDWGSFYAEARLLPHLRAAVDRGAMRPGDADVIERLCQRLRDGEFDSGRGPERIHGDLWAGNAIATRRGIVMIDPAAHGGNGENDLAMLALFGYPELSRIQNAYAEAAQLDDGWRDRVGLHQLHHLLVHAELFGAGYGAQAVRIASRYG